MRIIVMREDEYQKLYRACVSQLIGNNEFLVNPLRRLIDLLENADSVANDRFQRWLDTK